MIHCKQVSKYFRTKRALHEVDVHIKDHSLIGLVGRNGAGKTTLLKLIAGCWKATSGNIKVLNTDPFDNLFVSTNSILIDDDIAFPETLTLKELFSISEQFYPNWDGQLAHRLLTYFSLNEAAYYHQLSKGGKSTFNAIVGLATHAPLTIFDEPTTGMDRSVRFDFYEALLKDYLNHPRLMIISSHHIEEIEHMLEDLILIDEVNLVI